MDRADAPDIPQPVADATVIVPGVHVFWYLVFLLSGALGALGILRAFERLIFGGGQGPLTMQFGFGLGLLILAAQALRKARDVRRRIPRKTGATLPPSGS